MLAIKNAFNDLSHATKENYYLIIKKKIQNSKTYLCFFSNKLQISFSKLYFNLGNSIKKWASE